MWNLERSVKGPFKNMSTEGGVLSFFCGVRTSGLCMAKSSAAGQRVALRLGNEGPLKLE